MFHVAIFTTMEENTEDTNIIINVVSGLKLSRKGVTVKDADGHWTPIHYRQGELDGACAVYSLMMDLLYEGVISKDDIMIYSDLDKRTMKGKMLHHFLEDQGLVRDGYSFKNLRQELLDYFHNKDIDVIRKNPKCQDKIIQGIDELVSEDLPVIISVVFGDEGSHAMLAIGTETDADGNINKIFCLDPDAESPTCSYWNAVIDVSGKASYYWNIKASFFCKVTLDDYLYILRIDD